MVKHPLFEDWTTMSFDGRHVHFVGVGGVGMSAVAQLALDNGAVVSGCDAKDSPLLRALAVRGCRILLGHDPAHLDGVELVVRSSAIPDTCPELVAAHERRIPVGDNQIGLIIGQISFGGFGYLLGGQPAGVTLLRQQGGDAPAVLHQPVLGTTARLPCGCRQLVDTKNRIILARPEGRHRPNQIRRKLLAHLLGHPNHLGLNARAGQVQPVIIDELFQRRDLKRRSDLDADRPDVIHRDQERDFQRTERALVRPGRRDHHLRPVEETLFRARLAGTHQVLLHGLAENLRDPLAFHVIGDVKGADINDLTFERSGLRCGRMSRSLQ